MGSRDQRIAQRLDPLAGGNVIEDEIAVELPVGPAPAALLGLAGHKPDVPRPRRHLGLVVGAELAEVDRPALLLGPGMGLVKIAANRGLLLRRRLPGNTQLVPLIRPGRPLVGGPDRIHLQ